jgi:hypothetical protein
LKGLFQKRFFRLIIVHWRYIFLSLTFLREDSLASCFFVSILPSCYTIFTQVGMGLIFVSTAFGLWAFAMALGQKLQWRLNDSVANPVLLGLVAMMVFILGSVFLQPRAYEAGKSVSFVALTTVNAFVYLRVQELCAWLWIVFGRCVHCAIVPGLISCVSSLSHLSLQSPKMLVVIILRGRLPTSGFSHAEHDAPSLVWLFGGCSIQ